MKKKKVPKKQFEKEIYEDIAYIYRSLDKIEKKITGIHVILFASIIFFCFILVILGHYMSENEQKIIILDDKIKNLSFSEDCSEDVNLKAIVKMTQNIIENWYVFNMSNVNVSTWEMSARRLHEEGGVCRHASSYFKYLFADLGFYAKEISMPGLNHRVLMVWDNSSTYCLIDQDVATCQNLVER